jgi:hypothetical protein
MCAKNGVVATTGRFASPPLQPWMWAAIAGVIACLRLAVKKHIAEHRRAGVAIVAQQARVACPANNT